MNREFEGENQNYERLISCLRIVQFAFLPTCALLTIFAKILLSESASAVVFALVFGVWIAGLIYFRWRVLHWPCPSCKKPFNKGHIYFFAPTAETCSHCGFKIA
jgi:hypothetical protein